MDRIGSTHIEFGLLDCVHPTGSLIGHIRPGYWIELGLLLRTTYLNINWISTGSLDWIHQIEYIRLGIIDCVQLTGSLIGYIRPGLWIGYIELNLIGFIALRTLPGH